MSKPEFNAEGFRLMIPELCELSDSQMTPQVRQKLRDAECLSPAKLYDALAEIGRMSITLLSEGPPKVYDGDISGFVKAFCEVDRYYERPTD